MTVIMHSSLQRSLAFILANKLQSSTLLGTQLTRLFLEAYEVGARWWLHALNSSLHMACWHGQVSVLVARVLQCLLSCTQQGCLCGGRHCCRLPHSPQDDPSLVEAAAADLQAVIDRDPACDSFVQPLLFFKGFQVRMHGGRVPSRV
jgi:hypothetical protein